MCHYTLDPAVSSSSHQPVDTAPFCILDELPAVQALCEVVFTVGYDKDADQQVVDDHLVEILRLTPCLEEFVIQFNRWDEDNDPGMVLLVEESGEVELVDGSFRYPLVPFLGSLGVVLEGASDTHILFLDRSFLEMVSSRHRKGLLVKLHLCVIGHNWSYGLDSDDEVDLEELRETGLALDFVLDY